MNKLLAAVVLLSISFAANATTIIVEGRGSNADSARKDAFRTAIENVCGAMVLSDREHVNGTTTNNQVISYSSCNIQKYTVLEQSRNYVKLQVDVQPNQVAQRLQGGANNIHYVDQAALETLFETTNNEKQDLDSLLSEVFRDYPGRAFALKSNVDISKNSATLKYQIAWDPNFLESLRDVVKTFSQTGFQAGEMLPSGEMYVGWPVRITIDMYNWNWKFKPKMLYTQDFSKFTKLSGYFQSGLSLQIKTQLTNGSATVRCYPLNTNDLYMVDTRPVHARDGSDYHIDLFARTISNTISVPLQMPATEIYSVEVSVVSRSGC